MDYKTAVRFLYEARMFGMKLGLDNIRFMLRELGNPEENFFTVHIAGTNGKGSVAAMLGSVLHSAGVSAGLFTSPHISSFRERFRVDGGMITAREAADLVDTIIPIVRRMEKDPGLAHPTFYELVTAMAARHFDQKSVCIAVFETGLGGRLDATNALPSRIEVITRIGLDHQPYLGNTIEEIAFEKAGIIKEGAAVIVAPQGPGAMAVVEEVARSKGAGIIRVGKEVTWSGRKVEGNLQVIDVESVKGAYRDLKCPLTGRHQADNLACVVGTVEAIRAEGFHIPSEAVREGLAAVRWPARFEVVQGDPPFILDAAANPLAACVLAGQLEEFKRPGERTALVFGMLKGKNSRDFAEVLFPHVDELIVTEPESDRALPLEQLLKSIDTLSFAGPVKVMPSLRAALSYASNRMKRRKGRVLVTGSLFLMARAREFLGLSEVEEDFDLVEDLSGPGQERV